MSEITVNTTTAGNQYAPVITRLASGGFVVAWTSENSDQDVLAQRFDANGAPVDGEFRVNTTVAGWQSAAAIEALPGGGFIVAWQDSANNGDIYAQRFDVAGGLAGSEFRVNTQFVNAEYAPGIAVAPDGSFVIHWQSQVGGFASVTARAARYDAAGTRIGGDLFVDSTNNSYFYEADWLAISPTQYLLAYSTGGYQLLGRIVDFANVNPLGTPFVLNDPIDQLGSPANISLVRLADGNFAAAWMNFFANPPYSYAFGAEARVFDASGTPVSGVTTIEPYGSLLLNTLSLGALATGGFVAGWSENVSGSSVNFVRTFDALGDAIGGGEPVSAPSSNAAGVRFASLPDGTFAAVYMSGEVKLNVVIPGVEISGSGSGEVLNGTEGPDEINGLGGNDTINGLGGADELHGGDDADTVDGAGGADRIDGGAGADHLLGGAGDDTLFAGPAAPEHPRELQIADGLDHGLEVDSLSGGDGNDALFAGLGDSVDGGTGWDSLFLSFASSALGINLDLSQQHLGGSAVVAGGTITGAELLGWLDGSDHDDVVVGGTQATLGDVPWIVRGTINGRGGNDQLIAGFYASNLYGGAGNDTLTGSDGDGLLIGGSGADVINGGSGSELLSSADGAENRPYFNPDFETVPWLPQFDHGNEVDTINAGAGDDVVLAGYGDSADGGTSNSPGDVLVLSLKGATSGVTADFSPASWSFGGGTLTGFERVDWVEGSDFGDTISFGPGLFSSTGSPRGNQNVVAGGGNDTVTAGYYTSNIFGDDGDDFLDARASQYIRYIDGGAGNDIIRADSLSGSVEARGGGGNDTIYAYQDAFGDAGDDLIIHVNVSNSGYWFSSGGDGSDELRAATGGNRMAGGAGADYLLGASASDTLFSGDVDLATLTAIPDAGIEFDRIVAGDGDDIVAIGYGDDADGGTGTDALDLSLAGAPSGVILDTATLVGASPAVIGGGTIQGFEQLAAVRGSAFADQITVATHAFTATVYGGAGNDTLTATGSAVVLRGEAGADRLNGSGGDDRLEGGDGDDFIVTGAGTDRVLGGAGNDGFYFGPNLTAADQVNGGNGTNDQIGLEGNYTGDQRLVLGPGTIIAVEVIAALPGFSYDITTVDFNVPAGGTLTIFAGNLAIGDLFMFNGAAEKDGSFRVFGGRATDLVTTGAGDDAIFFGPGKFDPASDRVDGGTGANDRLALNGDYAITLDGTAIRNIDEITLLPGRIDEIGGIADYDLTLADSLIGAGVTMTVRGTAVETVLTVDGSLETDATSSIRIFGGMLGDTLTGGAGGDWSCGGLGGDTLTGGGGGDTFAYQALSETAVAAADLITDFATGDLVDLAALDADASAGGDQAFHLGATPGHAGDIVLAFDGGSNRTSVSLFVDGDATADAVVYLAGNHLGLGAADFVL